MIMIIEIVLADSLSSSIQLVKEPLQNVEEMTNKQSVNVNNKGIQLIRRREVRDIKLICDRYNIYIIIKYSFNLFFYLMKPNLTSFYLHYNLYLSYFVINYKGFLTYNKLILLTFSFFSVKAH